MHEGSYGALRGAVAVAVVLHVAAAGAFAFGPPLFDHTERPREAADWLADLAFFAVYAAPAFLAALALRRRPLLYAPAAALAFLLSFTALSGVTLVLLLPAGAYLLAFASVGRSAFRGVTSLAVVLAAGVLGTAAFGAAYARGDVVCWRYEIRTDGTRAYERFPAEVRSTRTGKPIFSSSLHLEGGVVEAGGGCEERTTPAAALASLGLLALVFGIGARFGAAPTA